MTDKKIPLSEYFNTKAPPLTDEETALASKEKVLTYPKVIRDKFDPPIINQEYGNISFELFDNPTPDGVYGLYVVRGAWSTFDKATEYSEYIIRNVDSLHKIHQNPVGYWGLITNNEKYSGDQLDVKVKDEDQAFRDRAAKENIQKNKERYQEIKENKEILEQESDIDADPTSLDYYTKKQVTLRECKGYIIKVRERERSLKKSLKKIEKELVELNKNYPSHIDQWLENYNKARRRVGLEDITDLNITGSDII